MQVELSVRNGHLAPTPDQMATPFAPRRDPGVPAPSPSETSHPSYGSERTVHTIIFRIWNPDSPHRELFVQETNGGRKYQTIRPGILFLKLTGD